MSETKRQNIGKFQQRANLPKYFRAGALIALVLIVLGIGIGFYRSGGTPEFRLKPEHTQLSKDVVAEINGYERTENQGDVKKYYIKADHARTFSDNHQELENVFLQVFNETTDKTDIITAQKALYIPEADKNFTGYFAGNVNIETRDGLKVKTEQVTYAKATDTAEIAELVEFERENIKGKSTGATVHIKDKKIELLKDVEINALAADAGDELAKNNLQSAKMTASYAMFDQTNGKIELNDKVFINITPNGANSRLQQPTDIKTNRASAAFENKELKKIDLIGNVDVYQKPTADNPKWMHTTANNATAIINGELKQLQLIENVQIETTANSSKPTKINTGYALYDKDADRFDLRNGVNIVTVEDAQPTTIKSNEATYEQTNGKISLNGAGEITQGGEYIKGDSLNAELYPSKKVKNTFARGNAFLRQTSPDRTTEISAGELNAAFSDGNILQTANAVGGAKAILIPAKPEEYAKVTMSAPNAIRLNFKGAGLLDQMQTDGRTTVQMSAPNSSADAADKRLTADSVKTFFNPNGKDLARAEAAGNAELFVQPLRAAPENYQTTVTAPRFDCEFFPAGNNAKSCVAATKTKTVRVPTAAAESRGTQMLLADRLNAAFSAQTQDIERFDADGAAKFTELDRNGIADRISFAAADEIVRLRGGEPTVWDSQARVKAAEIDWNTKTEMSNLRGNVSTTYYSQKQTGGATPFGATAKPVFLTAETAEFNHRQETGVYTGNARAWQDNNYVRADRLTIQQKQGQLIGDGSVQSVLYNAKRTENGRETEVPVYASAQKMNYNRDNRRLRYETDVDIRQGTDRITAGAADVYLTDASAVRQTIAEKNVVVTQPNRRAIGDYAQYDATDETVTLRGNPAKIDDAENGSSQGGEVKVFLRDKRVVSEGKSKQNTGGRIRSVYKVKN